MTNEINMLLAQNPNFKFVKVLFSPNATKLYTYKMLEDVEIGQQVIVDTPDNGLIVVKVEQILKLHELDLNPHYAYKWVVQVIDTTKYDEYREKENEVKKVINEAKTAALVETMQNDLQARIGDAAFDSVQKLVRL